VGKQTIARVVPVGGADRLHQIDQRRRDRRIDAKPAADDERKLGRQQRIGGRRERVRVCRRSAAAAGNISGPAP
jgi:hypothetical protein